MKVYFMVSDSKTPYWHIKRITKSKFDSSVPALMPVGVSSFYSIDLITGDITYKTMLYTGNVNAPKEEGRLNLNPNQIRGLLSRYDRCMGSEWIEYPEGPIERHDISYKLFFT